MGNLSLAVNRIRALFGKPMPRGLPSRERLSDPDVVARKKLLDVLVEASLMITSADGRVAPQERELLELLVREATGATLSNEAIDALVREASERLEASGRVSRMKALAADVTAPVERREVVGFAALAALCDHDLAPSELFVLHALGRSFGIRTEDVGDIVRSVAAVLAHGA